MFSIDHGVAAMPSVAATPLPASRPQPDTRVVERSAQTSLQQQHSGTASQPRAPTALDDLISSARQFAQLLDATGNVQVASSVSGFPIPHVDLYA